MSKVLIIEDDPIIANIYRSRLEKEGFEVEIAADGQTGFYRVHEARPDALLLDLMLPKMDGLQILKKIRAQKQFQKMPVLVFTNAYLPNMVQDATQSGANQVFNKAALTPRQIVDALNHALSSSAEAVGASKSTLVPAPLVAPSSVSAPPALVAPKGIDPAVSSPVVSAPTPSIPLPHTSDRIDTPDSATISTEKDDEFQAELRRSFLSTAPDQLTAIRKQLHDFLKCANPADRPAQLYELYRKVHGLNGNAAVVGLQDVSQMCAALEALLNELKEKPKNITPSTIRTITHSVDFLAVLFEKAVDLNLLESAPVNILVVDDEIISRRAVVYALDKAHLRSESLEDPVAAAKLLAEKKYDLVILDVDMPQMSGFDLCSKIRNLPLNQSTPVLFVTGLSDFESRTRSSLSGGNDLIAKPFMFIELTVKAINFVLKGRLAQAKP